MSNPEPQKVAVEAVKVTAALEPNAPAKARRPGIAVPPMEPHVPSGHVDAMANLHSWDL